MQWKPSSGQSICAFIPRKSLYESSSIDAQRIVPGKTNSTSTGPGGVETSCKSPDRYIHLAGQYHLRFSFAIPYSGYIWNQQYWVGPSSSWGAKINDLIQAGQYWRLVTPIWLHASIMHILFNMYALFVIGRGLEQQYGHERFLELYLLSGIAGNIASFLLSTKASLGASTAIFGLIAAQTVYVYQNRALYGKRAQNMLLNNVMIIVINLILGLSPGIDNMGHLGGLLGGLAFAWFAGPLWKLDQLSSPLALKDTRPLQRTRTVSLILLFVLIALSFIGIIRK